MNDQESNDNASTPADNNITVFKRDKGLAQCSYSKIFLPKTRLTSLSYLASISIMYDNDHST